MQFQAMNHAINKFSRFIQYHWSPHPEGSGCPGITPSGHVTSSDKITSNKKDHVLWSKGRVFPLLDRGFKQHYPFAKVHCICIQMCEKKG